MFKPIKMMFKQIADDISFILVSKHIVDIEQRDRYAYGAEVILLNASIVLVALLITILSGTWLHFICFVFVFIPLRVHCGGYHSKKSEVCFVISTLTYISTVIVSFLISELLIWSIIIILLCWIFIIMLSPVENENNPLSARERKMNKNRASLFISLDSIIFIMLAINKSHFAVSVLIFIILICIVMLIELIRLKMQNHKN